MKHLARIALTFVALAMVGGTALAATDAETVAAFKKAGESAEYFSHAYGYAVFPTIGKGGLGIGAAHGTGSVYQGGKLMGEVTMNQVSVGLQAGGQAYSEIIFFKDKSAYDSFTSGNFEFDAGAGVVAIKSGASASAGTTGATSSAGTGKKGSTTEGSGYYKGMAVFSIAKGGLMYEATLAGQKFKFKPAGK